MTGTAENLAGNNGNFVAAGVDVTVSDAATIAQLTTIDTDGNGTLTYTALEDTASNLATNTGSYVAAGKNVTVSDAATIAQLTTINADNGNGSLTYTAWKTLPATSPPTPVPTLLLAKMSPSLMQLLLLS